MGNLPSVGGVAISQVNELISNYGAWELEESFTSLDQQDAISDSLSAIDFGDSKTSTNGIIEYDDVNKYFRILKGGALFIKARARAARIGASLGESELFLQAQISTDDGLTWVSIGNSVDVKIDNARQVEIFFDFSPIELTKGTLVRQVFARSSLGTNFGSLIAGIPSPVLSLQGILPAPAAQVSVYRLKGFNYRD